MVRSSTAKRLLSFFSDPKAVLDAVGTFASEVISDPKAAGKKYGAAIVSDLQEQSGKYIAALAAGNHKEAGELAAGLAIDLTIKIAVPAAGTSIAVLKSSTAIEKLAAKVGTARILEPKVFPAAIETRALRVIISEKRIGHIFRDAEGHISDTPSNRKTILDVANNEKNLLGSDRHGNIWSARILPNGKQVWVQTRGNQVVNAGINDIPKRYDPERGLSTLKPRGTNSEK